MSTDNWWSTWPLAPTLNRYRKCIHPKTLPSHLLPFVFRCAQPVVAPLVTIYEERPMVCVKFSSFTALKIAALKHFVPLKCDIYDCNSTLKDLNFT